MQRRTAEQGIDMPKLLVIEDGREYLDFALALLQPDFEIVHAQSGPAAREVLATQTVDALLFDLRFDRSPADALLGDVEGTAQALFAGDVPRAVRYLQDLQGVLILADLRSLGHQQPAVFVHDFTARRLRNLRSLYGVVHAVPRFDADAIRRCLSQNMVLALGGGWRRRVP